MDLSITGFRFGEDIGALYTGYLNIFSGLLPLVSNRGRAVCIISGLDKLSDYSTNQYLDALLRVLRGSEFKVLFTTSRWSPALEENTELAERFRVVNIGWNSATGEISHG